MLLLLRYLFILSVPDVMKLFTAVIYYCKKLESLPLASISSQVYDCVEGLEPALVGCFTQIGSAILTYIRLGWKCLLGKNTLACYKHS
jgi:hypothetical protein